MGCSFVLWVCLQQITLQKEWFNPLNTYTLRQLHPFTPLTPPLHQGVNRATLIYSTQVSYIMMSWLHRKSVAAGLPWRRRGRCSCCRRGRESSWSAPRSALSGPPCDVCSPVGLFSPQPDFPRVGASCLQVYYRSSYLLQGNDAFYSRSYCWCCTTLQTISWPTAHVWVDQSESSRHFTGKFQLPCKSELWVSVY